MRARRHPRCAATRRFASTASQPQIYPGFPTDLQAPFSLALVEADGVSTIKENLYEDRFDYAAGAAADGRQHPRLRRAHGRLSTARASCTARDVEIPDLRAGATLVLAALAADGDSRITGIEHVARGYEDMVGKLGRVGARITRGALVELALPVEELVHQPDGLVVRCLRNIGPYENNIFIVSDADSGEAYVLDGGFEPEQIAAAADGLNVKAILVDPRPPRPSRERRHAQRRCSKRRSGSASTMRRMLSVEPDTLIVDQQSSVIWAARAAGDPHARAHARARRAFVIGKHLFTGDTLFPGGPGNTQKDPVRFERIIASIRERLFTLPDDTIVYPGHGRDTTIGAERPHLDEWIARGW